MKNRILVLGGAALLTVAAFAFSSSSNSCDASATNTATECCADQSDCDTQAGTCCGLPCPLPCCEQ